MSGSVPALLSRDEAEACYATQRVGVFSCTRLAWERLYGARSPVASSARWLDLELTTDRASALVSVPAELPCFEGHFPGRPLLPGVLQLVWARELLSCWQPGHQLQGVRQLKFRTPVEPPAVLRVVLHHSAGKIAARVERPAGAVADWSFVSGPSDTPGTS